MRNVTLLPVRMAAVAADINPYTVWKLIRTGRVRAYGRPRALRVALEDLLQPHSPPTASPTKVDSLSNRPESEPRCTRDAIARLRALALLDRILADALDAAAAVDPPEAALAGVADHLRALRTTVDSVRRQR